MNQRSSNWDKQHIRELRQHMKLTQAELARQLGTRQQTISEWETGMYKPRGASATLLTLVAERAGFSYQPDSDNCQKHDDSLQQHR